MYVGDCVRHFYSNFCGSERCVDSAVSRVEHLAHFQQNFSQWICSLLPACPSMSEDPQVSPPDLSVVAACANCRSAHKGCDKNGPPCTRCRETGQEKSCSFKVKQAGQRTPSRTPGQKKKRKHLNADGQPSSQNNSDDDGTQPSQTPRRYAINLFVLPKLTCTAGIDGTNMRLTITTTSKKRT